MDTKTNDLSFDACDEYMFSRTGSYEKRAVRYRKTADALTNIGLDENDSLYDLGSGWTELDYCLRKEHDWRGRYIPIDAGTSNVDLNTWIPERTVQHIVALEIIEHLHDPLRIIKELKKHALKSIIVSVPNPETVDVLGIDHTHISLPDHTLLRSEGFKTSDELFYGGVYSQGKNDAIFGIWTP